MGNNGQGNKNDVETAAEQPTKKQLAFNENDIAHIKALAELAKGAVFKNEKQYLDVLNTRNQLVKKIEHNIKSKTK